MKTNDLYEIFLRYPTISTDTRKITNECIFFALKGDSFDGNQFASQAISEGAAFAVVDDPKVIENDKFILVDDVLKSLQQLANFHRKQVGLPVLAITGTNGKTTTKELTASILSKKFNIVYTLGNLNNHIGVPLTLLRITKSTEIAIIEMGANHPGEIKFLCEIADPDFGLITNIGKAHLEGFGSFEVVIRTKTELYSHLQNKGGTIFFNSENQILSNQLYSYKKKIDYGTTSSNYLKGEVASQTPFLSIRAWFPKGVLYLNSKLVGTYNLENILAAACIGKFFEVNPIQIQEAICEYKPENHRSQLIKKGSNTIIMDAYNANPSSMRASIVNFLEFESPNKYFILGDMLELGESSQPEHQAIVDLLLSRSEKGKVFLVGNQFSKTTFPSSFQHFYTSASLSDHIKTEPITESMILIKGSRGIKLEKVLEALPD
jgi:UDP-N-acetylmuramoyl-tripeptide--D-alanyl-D-alanine ligase